MSKENARVSAEDIGAFVDSVAGKVRTPASVSGRLLEEVVELCLAAGLNAGQVMAHVADALHNQSLKASKGADRTVFPSQLAGDSSELAEECADVGLLLKDLCWVSKIDQDAEEVKKHEQFIKKTFRVSSNGTIYAVKSHVLG